MGIFKEMYDGRHFESSRDYEELRRMLSEAISNGFIEQIPTTKPILSSSGEQWFRDKGTGEIYSLVPPGERSSGWWMRLDPEDFQTVTSTLQ
jgi:hypothetical protein